MFRARGNIKSDLKTIRELIVNMNIRKRWETQLYEMNAFDKSEDGSFQKTFYIYRSPMGAAHREFLMNQQEWHDYPEPGMWTLHMCNAVDDRWQ